MWIGRDYEIHLNKDPCLSQFLLKYKVQLWLLQWFKKLFDVFGIYVCDNRLSNLNMTVFGNAGFSNNKFKWTPLILKMTQKEAWMHITRAQLMKMPQLCHFGGNWWCLRNVQTKGTWALMLCGYDGPVMMYLWCKQET